MFAHVLRLVGSIQLGLGLLYLFGSDWLLQAMGHSAVAADIHYPLGMLAARFLAYGVGLWVVASQPQAQAMHMLTAIGSQIEAIEGSTLPPPLALELLNVLRSAAVPGQNAIESRYVRKALPMAAEDERSFDLAQKLWLRLGVAYLRLTPHFPPAGKCLPLQRAACAFRMAQYCHFLAARECPVLLDRLLFAVLDRGHRMG